MEKHGLVKRSTPRKRPAPMCVHLTPKGRRLRDEMIPDVKAWCIGRLRISRPPSSTRSSRSSIAFEQNLVAEGGERGRGIEW